MAKFTKVGEGKVEVYKKEKEEGWGGVIGGLAVVGFILLMIF